MNKDVYDNLNDAKEKLTALNSSVNHKTFMYLVSVCEAVDDGLDELDRLGRRIRELEKSRFKGPENYLEFHENRDELQIKPNDF